MSTEPLVEARCLQDFADVDARLNEVYNELGFGFLQRLRLRVKLAVGRTASHRSHGFRETV